MSANKASKNHDKKKINLVEKIRGSLFNESHSPAVKEEILLTIKFKRASCAILKTKNVKVSKLP